MGGADFINVLYSEFLNYDPDAPTRRCRDRFFLDPVLYVADAIFTIVLIGNYTIDELKTIPSMGFSDAGHPEVCPERGIENTRALRTGTYVCCRSSYRSKGSLCTHR